MAQKKDKDHPFADRMLVLCGLVSAYFSIHSIQTGDPDIGGADQFLAFLFWLFAFVAYLATAPRTDP